MLKAILWDNDGVLVDTEGLYFRACREALARVDIELSQARFVDLFLKKSEGLRRVASEHGLGSEDLQPVVAWRNARYTELLQQGVPVIKGVPEALAQMHGKVRMGIVTSSRREHFQIIHASTGLLPFFAFALVREDYQHSKPDPEPYLTAMQQNNLQADECVVVEDSDRGLRAANTAGVRCIAIPQGLTADLNFSDAFRVLENISQLPPVIDQLMQI